MNTKKNYPTREEIYDEDLADDIRKGSYPDLKVKKLKNGKYVISMKCHAELARLAAKRVSASLADASIFV